MTATASPLQELSHTARDAESFTLCADFDLPNGKTASPRVCVFRGAPRRTVYLSDLGPGAKLKPPVQHPKTVADALRLVASTYPKGKLVLESLKVRAAGTSEPAAKLKVLAIRAWREAFGLPVPSAEDVAKERKAARAAKKEGDKGAVALLKDPGRGVKTFHKLSWRERMATDLRKADLSGCDLTGFDAIGVNLDGADLSGSALAGAKFHGRMGTPRFGQASLKGSNLAGADLTRAVLTGVVCAGSDFSRAKLAGANFLTARCRGAKFAGADLGRADFRHAELKGADFSGATLGDAKFERATFDENTKWPKGYKLSEELVWKGTGTDPRLAPTRREKNLPKPTDFAGFLDRLKRVTDAAKLDKALSMLKSEKFQLFSKVGPEHLVGVVKSQSSPDLVYSCRLSGDGNYACCTQNLNVCGGLRGSPCKHLLVLMVGLARAGALDAGTAHDWAHATRGRKPALDKDAMTETFLQYKGAEAGEVDWRPTETIPEDFYAV
jgi:hypothetical protein